MTTLQAMKDLYNRTAGYICADCEHRESESSGDCQMWRVKFANTPPEFRAMMAWRVCKKFKDEYNACVKELLVIE